MEWEWYTDANTTKVFLHCLLRANWKAGSWHGIHYKPGQFVTSLNSLAAENGLTIRQARTALEHLISTGEVSSTTTDEATGKKLTKNRIITVLNWDSYQGSDKQNDKQNDKHEGKQATAKRQAPRQSNDSETSTDIRSINTSINTEEDKEIKKGTSSPNTDDDDDEGMDPAEFMKILAERRAKQNGHL